MFDYSGGGSVTKLHNRPKPKRCIMSDRPEATASISTTTIQAPQSISSSSDFEDRFQELTLKWKDDCRFYSSPAQIAEHPAYQAIIEMGEAAIPFILRELDRSPDHWFVALRSITGANPVPPDHRGKIGLMARDWLSWGQSQGYV